MSKLTKFLLDLIIAIFLAIATGLGYECYKSLKDHPETINKAHLVYFFYSLIFLIIAGGLWFLISFINITPLPKLLGTELKRFIVSWKTEKQFERLAFKWGEYAKQGHRRLIWQIRAALAREYVDQEINDLGGYGDLSHRRWVEEKIRSLHPEGRPFIITSFVRYSKMVKEPSFVLQP
jgi:hypothetical protein